MNLGLKGKTALVTASSRGIGKAIAEGLIQEGCNTAICSTNKEHILSTVSEMKKKYNVDLFWVVCDLNNPKDIENTVDQVKRQFGAVDILVNNCGGPAAGMYRDLDEQKWQAAFEQVLLSVVRLCNLTLPEMIVKEWGRIINITSISVKQPIENLMLSNSLRSGVVGFAKSLSLEVAKFNITVNNIAPGYTFTSRLYDLAVHQAKASNLSHEEVLSDISKNIPMNRFARPDEIANAVVFLASECASYITGNTIQVDGGLVKSYY